MSRALLMIPGPIEVSPAVRESFSVPPPGHLAPHLIEAFGSSLERMRAVWRASDDAQPFVVAGGGTLAMDSVAANLVEPGERVVVVHTGYFSARMAEMLRRQGALVRSVEAPAGSAPDATAIDDAAQGAVAIFATHVDTSTGVRVDAETICSIARNRDALAVFDGVCATGGERFEMARWGADVYLTASQKALGLPPGLALWVAGPRAVERRARRAGEAPPMYLDWETWTPVMRAYEERSPSYFSTPATNLILALDTGLGEILDGGIEACWQRHAKTACALHAAWGALGLESIPHSPEATANTLSALRYPEGVDASLIGRIAQAGVVVAGGLLPEIRDRYFRIGHMGWVTLRGELLERTVSAVATGLGLPPSAAVHAFRGGFAAAD